MTQAAVAEIFGIGPKTFSNWIRLRKAGDFSRRPAQKKKAAVKLAEAALEKYSIFHLK